MHDVIVIGLGGMGSATASHLARRGVRVLGLEQFAFGHALGSSHGRTRIIRTAYYEHPDYIPLVQRAFAHWRDLEARTGRTLLTPCDCVTIGPDGGELIRGLRRAKDCLPAGAVTTLDSKALYDRFGFHVPDDLSGEIEAAAGILHVEDCVQAHQDDARRHGAELHELEAVTHWHSDGNTVTVETARSTYHAAKLAITAGPWAGPLLAGIGVPLTVMRQVMLWFAPHIPSTPRELPIFLVETPAGAYYGVPAIDAHGVKLARHYGEPELTSPAQIDRTIRLHDIEHAVRFHQGFMPHRIGECVAQQACIYTLTPDRHFVVDRHPQDANVVFACGFSGHGFKFAPAVGEALADLATAGDTALPTGFLGLKRFAES